MVLNALLLVHHVTFDCFDVTSLREKMLSFEKRARKRDGCNRISKPENCNQNFLFEQSADGINYKKNAF